MDLRHAAIGAVALLAACGGGGPDAAAVGPSSAGPPFMARPDPGRVLPLCLLPGGTIGLPDLVADPLPLPDTGNGSAPGAVGNAPSDLPRRVALRHDRQTFNRRYEFALRDGVIWYRSHTEVTGIDQPWAELAMPSCLAGTVIGISVDDDELIALRADGAIYGMDRALSEPLAFNWSSRWGPPVWTGTGHGLPADFLAWSWSVISPAEDRNWTDPAGNRTPIGQGKVSHIWLLRGGGQRYTYVDPWLPKDDSYEMCGPRRGRFVGVSLSASGSTIATVDAGGAIYTRHYDFDLGGNDPLFFQYSYDDQRGAANPAIQLPTFDWVLQPRVPGRITPAISLHKVGIDMQHRVLRVEGLSAGGDRGYWEREVADPPEAGWHFVATGEPLRGALLGDAPSLDAPNEDAYYVRARGADGWLGELLDFNVYCSPARLRISVAGDPPFEVLLHTTDTIRQNLRARGLDDEPRPFPGAIEVPAALLASLDQQPEATRAFIGTHFGARRFTSVSVRGVVGRIRIEEFEWEFVVP